MSNEQITNEQKAIDIAQWDGWILPTPLSTFYQNEDKYAESYELTKYYLYDLNYLMPVAVRLAKLLPSCDLGFDLGEAIFDLTETPSGTYQPLFDAVYEAIVYFENQNS